MQNTLSPKDLAQKTTDQLMKDLEKDTADNILDSLQNHYNVLNRTQELQIEFLTEFIKNLKHLQNQNKESLDFLKQRVLNHVLKSK